MTTPKPKLDLFADSNRLVSKKCRTSTPSLRPPKPPSKSSRSRRNYLERTNHNDYDNNGHEFPHEGSFSCNFSFNNSRLDEYSRFYQDFEVMCKIGSGHFADVYKVKSNKDGHHYAIKKTTIPFTSNSDRLRKLQEVKNHQSLPPHPNCVRYIDSWEEDGYLYIQTELCKTSLNELLENSEERKLQELIVWRYLYDLLLATKHLHDHDLIHLDIKPDNIFISFDGVAKLGDFGLMCSLDSMNTTKSHDISIDRDQTMDLDDSKSIDSIDEGDSKYLARETMQGKFTKAADIFSLGITIFEVASGLDLPQSGEMYHRLRHNEIEDLYFKDLSKELVKIIKMMMEEDHLKRPTVDDLLGLDVIQSRANQLKVNNYPDLSILIKHQ